MRLLGLLRDERNARRSFAGARLGKTRPLATTEFPEKWCEQFDDPFMGDAAGDGRDGGASVVIVVEKGAELRALKRGNRFEAARQRPAQRMFGPHRLREQFLGVLGRVIPI